MLYKRNGNILKHSGFSRADFLPILQPTKWSVIAIFYPIAKRITLALIQLRFLAFPSPLCLIGYTSGVMGYQHWELLCHSRAKTGAVSVSQMRRTLVKRHLFL